MKKIAIIFLLNVYTLSVLGIGIRQFYCCGKLKSTTITFIQEVKEKCGMSDAMKNCCKTKFKNFKVKDNHIFSDGFISLVKHFTLLHIIPSSHNESISANQFYTITGTSHAPPLKQGIPIYILHCVYRI